MTTKTMPREACGGKFGAVAADVTEGDEGRYKQLSGVLYRDYLQLCFWLVACELACHSA
jgi:hypothetical protein